MNFNGFMLPRLFQYFFQTQISLFCSNVSNTCFNINVWTLFGTFKNKVFTNVHSSKQSL